MPPIFPTPLGPEKIQAEKKEGLTAVLPMDAPDEDAKDGIADGNESSSTESSGWGGNQGGGRAHNGSRDIYIYGYIWIYKLKKKMKDVFFYIIT